MSCPDCDSRLILENTHDYVCTNVMCTGSIVYIPCDICDELCGLTQTSMCDNCDNVVCKDCADRIRWCYVCDDTVCPACMPKKTVNKTRTLCKRHSYSQCKRDTLKGNRCTVNTHFARRFCKRHTRRHYGSRGDLKKFTVES